MTGTKAPRTAPDHPARRRYRCPEPARERPETRGRTGSAHSRAPESRSLVSSFPARYFFNCEISGDHCRKFRQGPEEGRKIGSGQMLAEYADHLRIDLALEGNNRFQHLIGTDPAPG